LCIIKINLCIIKCQIVYSLCIHVVQFSTKFAVSLSHSTKVKLSRQP